MTTHGIAAKSSIRAAVVAAVISLVLLIGTLGGIGLYIVSAASRIVVATYDRPIATIVAARSASEAFAQMDKIWLRRSLMPETERAPFDEEFNSQWIGFLQNLTLALQRSLAHDERLAITRIQALFTEWNELRYRADEHTAAPERHALAQQIATGFDSLTGLIKTHIAEERQKAIWWIDLYRHLGVAALMLTLALSSAILLVLARRVLRAPVPPLRHTALPTDVTPIRPSDIGRMMMGDIPPRRPPLPSRARGSADARH